MRHSEHSPHLPLAGRHWLLGALLLVMLPHLLRLPVGLSSAILALFGWRFLRDRKGWNLPGTLPRLLLTLLGIAAILFSYRSLFGREAGVALLTLMLALKLLELRNLRDALVVIFLGYFLVVTGFLFSQSIFMGSYMFAVVLALTSALVIINHPQAGFRHSPHYLRTAGALLLQALPIMLLLFILFPRIPGPLWSLPKDSHSGRTGLSEEMVFGQITSLASSDEIAFRVQFDGPVPDAHRLYWRGPVLWHTDGIRWTPMSESERRQAGRPQTFKAESDAISYTITLEPHDKRWIFALDLPGKLPEFPGGSIALPDYQLTANNPVVELTRYRQISHLDYNTGFIEPWAWTLATELPQTHNPKTQALAQQWQDSIGNDADIVKQALTYFREEPFYYSRTPPAYLGETGIDEFLFSDRRGFCEHYAAAFTVLMRNAGIPARIATGYQGGEFNPVGNYLLVRQSDAHAWVEVWLDETGWTRADPTAMIPQSRIESAPDFNRFDSTDAPPLSDKQIAWMTTSWRKLKNNWDAMNHGWNQWVLGFDTKRQLQLLGKFGIGSIDWQGMLILLFSLLGILFTLMTLWLVWQQPVRHDPARRQYERYCAKLARKGLTRDSNEGPLDYANRVRSQRPDLSQDIDRITNRYNRLRYGRVSDIDDYRALKRLVKQFNP